MEKKPQTHNGRLILGYAGDIPVVDRTKSHIHYPQNPEEREVFRELLFSSIGACAADAIDLDDPARNVMCEIESPDSRFTLGVVGVIPGQDDGDIFWNRRVGRRTYTPFYVGDKEPRTTDTITAALRLKGAGGGDRRNLFYEIATAFVGSGSGGSREPGDPTLKTQEERDRALEVWSKAALVYEAAKHEIDGSHPTIHTREEFMKWLDETYATIDARRQNEGK